jgi:hypothetical protein
MSKKQQIILLHGSNEFNQTSAITQGELVVEHGSGVDKVKIHTLDNNGALATFVTESVINAIKEDLEGKIESIGSELTGNTNELTEAIASALTEAKAYTDELKNGQVATNTQAIADEASRAESAETALNTAIEAEVSRATSAETALTEAIATALTEAKEYTDELKNGQVKTNTQAIADEVSRATSAETELNTAIEELESDLNAHKTNTDVHIQDGERAKWDSAATAIETFMESAAISGDVVDTLVEIQKYITDDTSAADKMVKDIASNTQAIEAEVSRATSAETALTEAIATALTEAKAYTDELKNGQVKTNTQAIADEASRAESAETALNTAIEAEVSRATSAETALTEAIATALTESKAYTDELKNGQVKANTQAIADEVSRATSAETAMNTVIEDHESRLDTIEAGYVNAVEVTNAEANKIAASIASNKLTLNFNAMVIDGGEY